ncbi:MAG: PAS domain S-box protein, partial [Candidatus Bathyarchaeia archaeon]
MLERSLDPTSLLESVSEWIVITDEDYRIVYMNRAAKREYGDGIGKRCYRVFQEFKHPCYEKGLPCSYREIVTKGRRRYTYMAQDSKGRWLNVHSSLLKVGGRRYVVEIVHDITDRKRLEEELREQSLSLEKLVEERTRELKESEERFRSLIERVPAVLWTADAKGRTVYISPNARKVYGQSPEEIIEQDRKGWFARIHPEDIKKVRKAFQALFDKGIPFDVEYRVRRRDGGWTWIHDRASSTYTVNGVRYADGVFTVIDKRKRLEEALRRSEARFRGLYESIKDGVMINDISGQILECNKALEDMLGYTRDELRRMRWQEITPPQYLEMEEGIVKRQMLEKGYSGYIEKEYIRKDGSKIPVEVIGSVVKGSKGEPEFIVCTIRDISERKRMEEQLRTSEERYRLLVESSPDTILIHCDGKIIFMNRAGAALLGGEHPEQFVGKPLIEIVHPEYREVVKERARRAVEDRTAQPPLEEKFVRLDGSSVDVEVWTVLFTHQGRPAVQVVARDITERKMFLRQLEHHAQEIHELNESLIRRLTEKVSAADKLYRLRGEVLSSPDISTGLDKVLQGVVANFMANAAALLILDDDKRTVKVRGLTGDAKGVTIGQTLPLDEACETSVVGEAKPISIAAAEHSCIPGMRSIHYAPIMLKGEVHGILAVGERKSRILDSSDLMILALYAELASNLFELHRLVISPSPEPVRGAEERLPLEYGA